MPITRPNARPNPAQINPIRIKSEEFRPIDVYVNPLLFDYMIYFQQTANAEPIKP